MIIAPQEQDPIIERGGVGENRFIGWIREVTGLLNRLDPLTGSGSPEGVVEAGLHAEYIDTDYPSGATKYIKTTASGDTGWQVIG